MSKNSDVGADDASAEGLAVNNPKETTQADLILNRIKNKRWVAITIVLGTIFLALVSVLKGMEEAGGLLGKAFSRESVKVQYDASTKEAAIAVLRKMDHVLTELEESKNGTFSFEAIQPEVIDIDVDLRSLQLRTEATALDDKFQAITVQQCKNLLEVWDNLKQLLKATDHVSPELIKQVRALLSAVGEAMVSAEEAKANNNAR